MGCIGRAGTLSFFFLFNALAGCSSTGDDLFDQKTVPAADAGTATGGSSGTGGSDATGGTGATGGATGGSAGATGGSGGATGGSGGTGATGGTGGTGGTSATGGSSGTGATGGTGAMGGSGGGATGGTGGSSGGPIDCSGPCGDACEGGTWTTACDNCEQTVCGAILDKALTAPGYGEFDACMQYCGDDSQCWNGCCQSNIQACTATNIYWACVCGYEYPSCTSQCSEACTGGSLDQDCQTCLASSPCTTEFYDYQFASDAQAFSTCRYNCTTPGCFQDCCNQYPNACLQRTEAVDCLCQ